MPSSLTELMIMFHGKHEFCVGTSSAGRGERAVWPWPGLTLLMDTLRGAIAGADMAS